MLTAHKFLEVARSRGERRLQLERVYRKLQDKELFLMAYANLYANQGALTPGTDPRDTVDGMSLAKIRGIIQDLKNGTYEWKPSRRTYMDKGQGKSRPLGLPGWKDKLLQEVIRLVLSAYYEPQFSEYSHGFREGRGCHTALREIKDRWKGTKWFITGDIRGCFENIDHKILLGIIERDIPDQRLLKLLRGMLEAGYLEEWRYNETYSGTPQGGVVSPILSNVVLNELDKWIEDELIVQHTNGQQRKRSAEYARLIKRRSDAKRQGQWKRYAQLGKELRLLPSKDPYDPDFRRLRFVRFADDFLLGYVGTKPEAEGIKEQISEFLAGLGLTLSQEKTLITHARSETAKFLGYEISISWSNDKLAHTSQGKKMRSVNGHIHLGVPHLVATKWMQRYCVNGKPQHSKILLHYSDYEIVTTYGAQIRGLTNYYLLAPKI